MIHAKLADAPYRVDIVAAGHPLVADEPEGAGGSAAGPAPFELVLSGLAACTLITLRMYAERKGWAGFTASGRFHRVDDGRHLIDAACEVSGAPERRPGAAGDIVERTPVTLALKDGFTISTTDPDRRREDLAMANVTYEIVEHDGGWAYRVDGVYSETFRSHDAAKAAARRAAGEQRISGDTVGISWEDDGGRWHEELDEGDDRPDTDVKG